MSPLHESQTKRRQISGRDAASHNEPQTLTEMEELYWFAMALTGDPEFATRLVVDTGKLTSTGAVYSATDSATGHRTDWP